MNLVHRQQVIEKHLLRVFGRNCVALCSCSRCNKKKLIVFQSISRICTKYNPDAVYRRHFLPVVLVYMQVAEIVVSYCFTHIQWLLRLCIFLTKKIRSHDVWRRKTQNCKNNRKYSCLSPDYPCTICILFVNKNN